MCCRSSSKTLIAGGVTGVKEFFAVDRCGCPYFLLPSRRKRNPFQGLEGKAGAGESPLLTSVFQLDTLRENCGIIRKQASTDGGVLWKVMCVDVVQVR
ncbi:hypothetical protein TNCV_1739911 [Trichonephila clavipes]|nr:hypothetical protein TNCV_1739911 [Trichonephila clavipes]